MTNDQPSLQEHYFPISTCFGCGPMNPDGLHLRSYQDPVGDPNVARSIAQFLTTSTHDNGLGYVNGGIIATLLDCHSAGSAMMKAERLGWVTAEGAAYPCVTAGMNVQYLRPTPLGQALHLSAEVVEHSQEEISVLSSVSVDDKVRAEALVRWRRWRPR